MTLAQRFTFGDRERVAVALMPCVRSLSVRHRFLGLLHREGFRDVRAIGGGVVRPASFCPTYGGHFEGLKFPRQVYVCSTRRRKPGACPNTLALPMEYADDVVLTMIEGEILGTKFIEELLAMVDPGQADNLGHLMANRDRVKGEIDSLIKSIAMGQPAASMVSAIRERELELQRLETRVRTPKQAPNIERLRDALNQRAAEWKETLRAEPKVARLLLRRLIGPLVLHDESQRPDFIKADAMVTPGLIDGLAEVRRCASETGAGSFYKMWRPRQYSSET